MSGLSNAELLTRLAATVRARQQQQAQAQAPQGAGPQRALPDWVSPPHAPPASLPVHGTVTRSLTFDGGSGGKGRGGALDEDGRRLHYAPQGGPQQSPGFRPPAAPPTGMSLGGLSLSLAPAAAHADAAHGGGGAGPVGSTIFAVAPRLHESALQRHARRGGPQNRVPTSSLLRDPLLAASAAAAAALAASAGAARSRGPLGAQPSSRGVRLGGGGAQRGLRAAPHASSPPSASAGGAGRAAALGGAAGKGRPSLQGGGASAAGRMHQQTAAGAPLAPVSVLDRAIRPEDLFRRR